jgi:hypothetical protein
MASVSVDTHLFGSRRGYECLAKSPGVSAAEDRALSEFGFGQSSDDRFLRGLVSSPTAFARALPGGRIGVTRVLAGPLDDSGRPTLERRTILLSAREYLALRRGMERLISENQLWASADFAAGKRVVVPVPSQAAQSPTDQSWRIFDAWYSARERPPFGVVVGSSDQSAAEVLATLACIDDADVPSFSWGVRLLSPIQWVDVMSISPFGAMDGRRQVFGTSRGECVNAVVESARTRVPGRIPRIDDLVAPDLEPARPTSSRRTSRVGRNPSAAPRGQSRRRRFIAIGSACVLGLAIGLVALVLYVGRGKSAPPPESLAGGSSSDGFTNVVPTVPQLAAAEPSGVGGSGIDGLGASGSTGSAPATPPTPPVGGADAVQPETTAPAPGDSATKTPSTAAPNEQQPLPARPPKPGEPLPGEASPPAPPEPIVPKPTVVPQLVASDEQALELANALNAHSAVLRVIAGVTELEKLSQLVDTQTNRVIEAQKRGQRGKQLCQLLQECISSLHEGFSELSFALRGPTSDEVQSIKRCLSNVADSDIKRKLANVSSLSGEERVELLCRGLVLALKLDSIRRFEQLPSLNAKDGLDGLHTKLSRGCQAFFASSTWAESHCSEPGDPPDQVFVLGLLSRSSSKRAGLERAERSERGMLIWAAIQIRRDLPRNDLAVLRRNSWETDGSSDGSDFQPGQFVDWLQAKLVLAGEGDAINRLVNEVKAALEKP